MAIWFLGHRRGMATMRARANGGAPSWISVVDDDDVRLVAEARCARARASSPSRDIIHRRRRSEGRSTNLSDGATG